MSFKIFFILCSVYVTDCTPGLYYDHIHNVRLTSGSLQLTTFLDVDNIFELAPDILPQRYFETGKDVYDERDDQLRRLDKLCSVHDKDNITSYTCDFISHRIPYLKQQREKIALYTDQINLLFYKDTIKTKRNEPVPYPFVGTISKSLFGILNNNDYKNINDEITKLKIDNKESMTVMNKTVHLVQSELYSIHDRLNNSYNTIENTRRQMNSFIKNGEDFIKTMDDKIRFSNFLTIAISWFENIERLYEEYIHALEQVIEIDYFARLGLIHPMMLSSKKIENSLRHFLQNNNNHLVLPLTINEVGVGGLGKVGKISLGYHDRRMILVINIPLLAPKIYSIYQLHPAPVPQQVFNSNIIAYIKPRTSFVLMAQDKTVYSTNVNIQDCKFPPTVPTPFCVHSFPLLDSTTIEICKIGFING